MRMKKTREMTLERIELRCVLRLQVSQCRLLCKKNFRKVIL
jgi:hypothetical protein